MNNNEDDDLKGAKKYVNKLLSIRPRSEKEVKERLKKKGFTPRTISQVTDLAKGKNLINDERFAQEFVNGRLSRKPKGKFALRRELQAKGIDEEIIQKTLDKKFKDLDVGKIIKELAVKRLKRYRGEDTTKQYRKTTDFLKRRGFPPPDIYEIVKKLVAGKSDYDNLD